jgi:hypothetical protein
MYINLNSQLLTFSFIDITVDPIEYYNHIYYGEKRPLSAVVSYTTLASNYLLTLPYERFNCLHSRAVIFRIAWTATLVLGMGAMPPMLCQLQGYLKFYPVTMRIIIVHLSME